MLTKKLTKKKTMIFFKILLYLFKMSKILEKIKAYAIIVIKEMQLIIVNTI